MSNEKDEKISEEIVAAGWGARIEEILRKSGLGQKEFAESLGFTSGGFISDAIREKKMPGGLFFLALKLKYDVSIDWLFTGEPTGIRASDVYRALLLGKELIEAEGYPIEKKARAIAAMAKLKSVNVSDADTLEIGKMQVEGSG